MTNQNKHFSNVADKYRDLRTTDLEPVLYIKKSLEKLPRIEAADVGCGAGRYDLQLFKHLGDRLYLNCFDANGEMLSQLGKYLSGQGINNFRTKRSYAETLPLESNSLDCIFTFNAIHHFNLTRFLREALRALKSESYLFIYTRLRSQNSRNIWGMYFPLFTEKETRLYELNEIQEIVRTVQAMKLEAVEYFKYERKSDIGRLIEQAENHHYSTFDLYTKGKFSKSVEQFKQNLNRQFEDPQNIGWFDENILLVLRKS
ncbi:MAG: class I SAM-dependent methyltransferase [Planctomycetota bacterium]|jgi:ubiquinone/menaquinone biosynthesis C-methylase UbiE